MLSEHEKLQLDWLGLIGFDILRVEAGDTRLPCWLCCSPETQAEARNKAMAKLNKEQPMAFPLKDHHSANEYVALYLADKLQDSHDRWVRAEEGAKTARKSGDPQAYFV